ncbi:hypothetical protein G1K75_00475 [Tenacibaculum finnmarkense]|uniref:hypothetical protein n=1 Tax=Tenacibaculum finnmarkense TaxID=2781243 RepID=UPI001EFB26DF|nr:hypothetical protein [Tenacibaculum finnmarkense]MCG8804140.1 hypothetical protein [Tenacibaculum finnmarkense]MCG8856120.1 hypothetical protein [Tenacibaculum finnmarkense]
MDKLFDEWKKSTPKFDKNLQHLFDSLSRKFGGAENDREDKGKIFSNNYELYIYAFFLGLYNDKYEELPENAELKDFSHAIQHWGSTKSNNRNDFTNLQQYMFMAVIAKTEGIEDDLIELDKGKKTVDAIKKRLHKTLQNYTNGGLLFLEEKIQEDNLDITINTSMLDLILKANLKEEKVLSEV